MKPLAIRMLSSTLLMAWACSAALSLRSVTPAVDARNAKAEVVMQQVEGAIAASKMSLVMAQAHHAKLLKKIRGELGNLLGAEAQRLGIAVGRYAEDLAEVSAKVQRSINASKAEVVRAEAAAANATGVDSWASPEAMARAKLRSQVGGAEAALRRAAGRRDFDVHQAVVDAEAVLQEGIQPLSRKLGDVSSLVSEASKDLEAKSAAVATTAASQSAAAVGANLSNGTGRASSVLARLTGASRDLADVEKKSRPDIAESERRLKSFLAETATRLAANVTDMKNRLEQKEQAQLQRLRGGRIKGTAGQDINKHTGSSKRLFLMLHSAAASRLQSRLG